MSWAFIHVRLFVCLQDSRPVPRRLYIEDELKKYKQYVWIIFTV